MSRRQPLYAGVQACSNGKCNFGVWRLHIHVLHLTEQCTCPSKKLHYTCNWIAYCCCLTSIHKVKEGL